jgi:RTA1 like protein
MVNMANDYSFSQKGLHVMQAGLAFQVASLLFFVLLCAIFAGSCYGKRQQLDEQFAWLRAKKRFRAFLWSKCSYGRLSDKRFANWEHVALSIATIAMLIRCAFRVAELSAGFHGRIWYDEIDFMVLEGAMVSACVLLLTLMHPGLAFCGRYREADFKMRMKNAGRVLDRH